MKFNFYKIVIFTLAFIYVSANMGISVISHYCGGELQEVAYFTKPNSYCGEEEETEDDGCCKNETQYFSYQNDFTFSVLSKDIKKAVLLLPFNHYTFVTKVETSLNSLKSFYPQFNYPPPDIVQRDIVSVSVLRI